VWRLLLDPLKVNYFDWAKDPRQHSPQGVSGIVYARGAPAIQIVEIPARVTVLLGLTNPARSWTGTVGPSLSGFTIAPCVDSLLCYRIVQAA
jgi:hypothetical protein